METLKVERESKKQSLFVRLRKFFVCRFFVKNNKRTFYKKTKNTKIKSKINKKVIDLDVELK